MLLHWSSENLLQALRKYFRLQVFGEEHLPKRGAALIAANHSGFAGLDALLLADSIHQCRGRIPRSLAHKFWFQSDFSREIAHSFGFVEARLSEGLRALEKKNLVIIFPEGEAGNFKPSTQMYQLQDFRSGVIRLALKTQTPIVPCLILGAEESQINITQWRLPKFLQNLLVPLPLNLVPLPARWRIHFFPPIDLLHPPESAEEEELVRQLAEDLQEEMQHLLNRVVLERESLL